VSRACCSGWVSSTEEQQQSILAARELLYDVNGAIWRCWPYHDLMTRHNLDSHLSWLLSHQVVAPSDAPATIPAQPRITRQDTYVEVEADGEVPDTQIEVSSLVPRKRFAQTVNEDTSIRPALLPSNPINKSLCRETTGPLQKSMATLSSTSRSARPDFMSQRHQLATPASSTSSSSLIQGYAALLRAEKG
jgi:bloom syndrome protein